MRLKIQLASAEDITVVSELVHSLLTELAPNDIEPPALDRVRAGAAKVLTLETGVWILLAIDPSNTAIGVLTLNEGSAIYASGQYGTINELYVRPEFRSNGAGPQLLAEAVRIGRAQGWDRMEVGAPSVPRWARTVAFYKDNGFVEIGPRLKLSLA